MVSSHSSVFSVCYEPKNLPFSLHNSGSGGSAVRVLLTVIYFHREMVSVEEACARGATWSVQTQAKVVLEYSGDGLRPGTV